MNRGNGSPSAGVSPIEVRQVVLYSTILVVEEEGKGMCTRGSHWMRLAGLLVTSLTLLLVIGCAGGGSGGQEEEEKAAAAAHDVFVGRLTGVVAMIGIDAGEPEEGGTREIRAYVCDGLGPPDGKVAWFRGSSEDGNTANLTSSDGEHGLRLALVEDRAFGTYTDAAGESHPFEAPVAFAGAAVYEMSITEGGSRDFSGESTDGGRRFEARDDDEDGRFDGRIFDDIDEVEVDFEVNTLGSADAEELIAAGLPRIYGQYQNNYNVPDSYFAIVSPGGQYWFGRSGDIRGGSVGNNLVGLKGVNAPDFSNAFNPNEIGTL
jgi:hypothetical protein